MNKIECVNKISYYKFNIPALHVWFTEWFKTHPEKNVSIHATPDEVIEAGSDCVIEQGTYAIKMPDGTKIDEGK